MRYVRTKLLKLTQRDMAEKMSVARSLIPAMESDKQGVSKATAQKLYEIWGISIAWMLMGEGEPTGSDIKYEQPTAIREPMSGVMRKDVWRLFFDPECVVNGNCVGFGYADLSGTKLRIQAGRDDAIANSKLFEIVESDQLWLAAGEPTGWEFEVLRAYFDAYADRSRAEWMECIRMIRWVRKVIQMAPAAARQQIRRTA